MDDMKIIEDIAVVATSLLTHSTDDYAMRIWEKIKNDVTLDIFECSGVESGDGFTDGDVALAIGRVLLQHLGEDE